MQKADTKNVKKPNVVYDIRMPEYNFRDDSGKTTTIDMNRRETAKPKIGSLGNLCFNR